MQNMKAFFDVLRTSTLFGGKISQGVVDTLLELSQTYESEKKKRGESTDLRELAYIMSTAYHESYHSKYNTSWAPIREGYKLTDSASISAVTSLFNQGRIKTNYALPIMVNGVFQSYFGRGWVQITWKDNYAKMGARIGVDLLNNPSLALDRPVASKLIIVGMLEGLYTGKKLSNYITSEATDFIQARRIINGVDKANQIAEHARKFYDALTRL